MLWTALVTPFRGGALDEEGLRANVAFQREHVDGILALGTTGESPTLTPEEAERVVAICRESGMPLMVGTGTNCTRTTIERTRWAKERGADVALIITPYYNKPPQEGIYRHFMAVADAVDIPIIVYNHGGRAGVNIETETMHRLASHPRIVGVKEVTGDLEAVCRIPDFEVYAGDDERYVEALGYGAKGLISVLSNAVPQLMRRPSKELEPYLALMRLQVNPIPIKALMNAMGMAAGECRLPLTPPSQEVLQWLEEIHALPR